MTVRVGINGFGRIGRSFTRALLARGERRRRRAGRGERPVRRRAHHGVPAEARLGRRHAAQRGQGDRRRLLDRRQATIKKLEERDPAEIPWGDNGVDVVIESTGLFTARDEGRRRTSKGGAKRVVISAPSGDADAMICMGVNDDVFDPTAHTVISNASCTTNCLAPMAKVLHDAFGIEQGLITTVHAYTSDQQLQDQAIATRSGKPDLRRMRAAALSIIPNTTGAARAIGLVHARAQGQARRHVAAGPDADRLDHRPRREPRARGVDVDEINAAFAEAANDAVVPRRARVQRRAARVGRHRRQPVVVHLLVARHDGERARMVKVLGWYDNEWGYSNRLVDLVSFIGDR